MVHTFIVPALSLFCTILHQQPKLADARRPSLTPAAASRAAAAAAAAQPRASFVGAVGGGGGSGGRGNMHARRMLSAHVWRTASATRALARPRSVLDLTRLQGDQHAYFGIKPVSYQ